MVIIVHLPLPFQKRISHGYINNFSTRSKIENTLIKVEDIKAEFSEATEAYDEFFKVVGERETDTRLDVAAEHLKELIAAVREGFRDNGSKLDNMGSSLKEISGKQDELIDTVDDVTSEIKGLRSDLKGRVEERLQSIESDMAEVKAWIRQRA